MTLEAQDKKTLSDIRMSKAYKYLEDAGANYKDGRYNTSINRSYYAVLSAARAILILEGVNPETHEGTVTMLSLRFIKPGLLPVDVIKKFKILLSRRTDADYGDFEVIDNPDAADSIKLAEEIIRAIDNARKTMY
ncbi:MAG: HEPN domain-containing protein [Nitrospirae bacterium]|nr:HEPN domain-containing protein [Nitrospirota bacterium]